MIYFPHIYVIEYFDCGACFELCRSLLTDVDGRIPIENLSMRKDKEV